MQRSGLGAKTCGEKPGLSDEETVVWMSSLCLCVPDAITHHSGVRCPLFSSPSSCLRFLLPSHYFQFLQFSLHHSAAPFLFFILISSRSQGKPSFLPFFASCSSSSSSSSLPPHLKGTIERKQRRESSGEWAS